MKRTIEKGWVAALFGLYVLLGVAIHGSYGISWDEPLTRLNGLVNLKHVSQVFTGTVSNKTLQEVPDLADWPDRDYGVAFELPLAAVEVALGLDEHRAFRFRHLATFFAFALGVAALYQTASAVRGSRWMGLAAALMMVLSPRMFGESFFNSKDIVFMSACAAAIFTMHRFLRKPSAGLALLHGAVSAFAIDIRVMGVVLPALTLGALLVTVRNRDLGRWRGVYLAGVYLLSLCVVVYALFPYLWPHPLDNFLAVFANMSRFRWNGEVMYLGELVKAQNLPWHYIPVWIGISTPIPFTAFMLLGAGLTLLGMWRAGMRLWANDAQRMDLLCLALLVGPIAAVILLKSVLYDGWRQLYFVYPAFVLLAVRGLDACWGVVRAHRGARWAAGCGLAALLVYQVHWIVQAHPLQNVYLNALAGKPWNERFDLDYWGLGNRQALEYILDHDRSPLVTVNVGSRAELETTYQMLAPKYRDRLAIVDNAMPAMYVLTNYRLVKAGEDSRWLKDRDLFYRKEVSGQTIVSVYRMRDPAMAMRLSRSERPYTADEIGQVTVSLGKRTELPDRSEVEVLLSNASDMPFSAVSGSGNQLALTWRFRSAAGQPGEWEGRLDLPEDIPPRGTLRLNIGIEPGSGPENGLLEVDLFQTGQFWAHQVGGRIAAMPWRPRGPAARQP